MSGVAVTLRLKRVNTKAAAEKKSAALTRALGVMAENALADSSDYIPYETGAMRASGRSYTSDKHAYVEWGGTVDTGRYTRRQYEDASLNHNTPANAANAPKATDHWFDAVKQVRLPAWVGMVEKILKG